MKKDLIRRPSWVEMHPVGETRIESDQLKNV